MLTACCYKNCTPPTFLNYYGRWSRWFSSSLILLTVIFWNLVHRLVGFKLRCAKIFKQCDSCIIKDHTADANQSHWMVGTAKIAMSYIVLALSHFALRVWRYIFFFLVYCYYYYFLNYWISLFRKYRLIGKYLIL